MGGGGAVRPPMVFCPLLKKSLGNPYLKILDFSYLLVADTPMIITLVEIIFRYHQKYLRFLGPSGTPPTTKKKKSENFTYGVLGIKIG